MRQRQSYRGRSVPGPAPSSAGRPAPAARRESDYPRRNRSRRDTRQRSAPHSHSRNQNACPGVRTAASLASTLCTPGAGRRRRGRTAPPRVIRLEAPRPLTERIEFLQGAFLELEVGLDVLMGGIEPLVVEPQRNGHPARASGTTRSSTDSLLPHHGELAWHPADDGRIPDFPVTRSHPPASWPSAANSSICRTYRKTAGEESRRRSPVANRWMRP